MGSIGSRHPLTLSSGHDRPPAVICDVDGTLVDVRDVRRHVDPSHPEFSGKRNFNLFHKASRDAPTVGWVVDLVRAIAEIPFDVAIVSAREQMWGGLTTKWLEQHGVPFDEIHFRRNQDYRPDIDIKRQILRRISRRREVVLAIDDRETVLPLWRRAGIPLIQVGADTRFVAFERSERVPSVLLEVVGRSLATSEIR
jgi:hypothetical protein